MNGLAQQFAMGLRLYFRNRMALFYGYLFPAIFLLAFWVLYRYEPVPLARHMGQLLTVTVLGGACLGMPTTMVSERERGVWRLYRLTPISTGRLVASAVLLRHFLVITAGLLQFALAMSIGMPLPRHPVQLALCFTVVAFAFLGLGLVIAAMADNVPAVQALGQCIFLPMLIIGGVAVPLASLPEWALHASAFFPGRYAVEALQACITGNGMGGFAFDLMALLLIGVTGFTAGGWMFRWEPQQRISARGKLRLVMVIAAWAAVGLTAELRGWVAIERGQPQPAALAPVQPAAPPAMAPAVPVASAAVTPAPRKADPVVTSTVTGSVTGTPPPAAAGPPSWQAVTIADILNHADFDSLPPDGGIISPIARPGLDPPAEIAEQLHTLAAAFPVWQPGNVADPVQRVRNLLYVAAVPDVLEAEILEGYVPLLVFERLQREFPKQDLIRLLYWVATHPSGGDDRAAYQLQALGLGTGKPDLSTVRERVTLYSLKLLGRLLGRLPSQ